MHTHIHLPTHNDTDSDAHTHTQSRAGGLSHTQSRNNHVCFVLPPLPLRSDILRDSWGGAEGRRFSDEKHESGWRERKANKSQVERSVRGEESVEKRSVQS